MFPKTILLSHIFRGQDLNSSTLEVLRHDQNDYGKVLRHQYLPRQFHLLRILNKFFTFFRTVLIVQLFIFNLIFDECY